MNDLTLSGPQIIIFISDPRSLIKVLFPTLLMFASTSPPAGAPGSSNRVRALSPDYRVCGIHVLIAGLLGHVDINLLFQNCSHNPLLIKDYFQQILGSQSC